MTGPPVIVFDVNETLLDLKHSRQLSSASWTILPYYALWFADLVLYSEAVTLAGTYVPFTKIGGAVLKMLATTQHIAIAEADRAELTEKFASMPPYREMPEALQKLRQAGFRLCTLTNNTAEISSQQVERAGLLEYFERRFSVDEVRRHKPAPEVYAAVVRAMQTEPSKLCRRERPVARLHEAKSAAGPSHYRPVREAESATQDFRSANNHRTPFRRSQIPAVIGSA